MLYIKRYLLAFGQALEAATLDGGVMNEHILAAVLRGNEAESTDDECATCPKQIRFVKQ